MSERVTQAEFARRANVNRSTVNRWIRAGRISVGPDGRIDAAQALRERMATESPMPHHQARKAQIDDQKEQQAAGGALGEHSVAQDVSAGLKYQTYLLQKAKAELAALDVDVKAGALAERAEFDYVVADFGGVLRGLLEGMADRLTGAIVAHRGDANAVHKVIDDAARDMLVEISEHMARRAAELGR